MDSKRQQQMTGYAVSTLISMIKEKNFLQDLLWTLVPQWDYFDRASTADLPRPWQVHNHCLPLTNNRGISGAKVSQWKLFKCMRDKHGEKEFNYMPESLILPE